MVSIIARRGASTTPAPAGLHSAVCVDVQDQGLKSTAYGEKHKVRIVWQIEALDQAKGRRFELSRVYTLSLHERAPLRKDLESWRGRKFTEAELTGGFDLEKLLGINCQLQAMHDTGDDGTTYANVVSVLPAQKGRPRLLPDGYVRLKDRQQPIPVAARRA